MTKWNGPMIYDRTASDIENRTAKAFFNISDWLRVYGNSEIANQLVTLYLGVSVPFSELTPPSITSFPTITEINTLIENIELARAVTYLPGGTGIVALKHSYQEGINSDAPNYTDVNNWERDLTLIRNCLASVADYRVYCGVSHCGQTRFYQNRWRKYPWIEDSDSPIRTPRTSIAICGAGLTRQNSWRRYA